MLAHPNPPEYVNCGKCHGCKREKARQWTIRMRHEALDYDDDQVEAITLTYADSHLPEASSLRYEDVQRWLEKMRYRFGPFRYFLCGEYGETRTKRPHYHVITYGLRVPDRYPWLRASRSVQCRSDTLEATWDKGFILCDETGADRHAIAYAAGYVNKKVYGEDFTAEYDMWVDERTGEILQEPRVPPFTRMSLRPGIGGNYIARHWREVYATDTVALDGREYKPPFYYDKWMATDHDSKCGSYCPDHMAVWHDITRKRWEEREGITHDSAKRRRQKGEAVKLRKAQFEQRKFDA